MAAAGSGDGAAAAATASAAPPPPADAAALEVDGSVLEGGGQVLRVALALSVLLQRAVRVHSVRAGRSVPGLRAQHAACVTLLAALCDAQVDGCAVGSSELRFAPRHRVRAGTYSADTGTAGATSLLLQCALPVCALADGPVTLVLRGGTDAAMAPPSRFLTDALAPLLERTAGVSARVRVVKCGFFPRGGGELVVEIVPGAEPLRPVVLTERGALSSAGATCWVAGAPAELGSRMAAAMQKLLRKTGCEIESELMKKHTYTGSCYGVQIVAEFEGGAVISADRLSERGRPAEQTAIDAASCFLSELEHGGCVDEHLQDQLIIFMALARGTSRVLCGPLSMHTRTALFIVTLVSGVEFTVEPQPDGCSLVSCTGLAFVPGRGPQAS